jgi:hypothetical protein
MDLLSPAIRHCVSGAFCADDRQVSSTQIVSSQECLTVSGDRHQLPSLSYETGEAVPNHPSVQCSSIRRSDQHIPSPSLARLSISGQLSPFSLIPRDRFASVTPNSADPPRDCRHSTCRKFNPYESVFHAILAAECPTVDKSPYRLVSISLHRSRIDDSFEGGPFEQTRLPTRCTTHALPEESLGYSDLCVTTQGSCRTSSHLSMGHFHFRSDRAIPAFVSTIPVVHGSSNSIPHPPIQRRCPRWRTAARCLYGRRLVDHRAAWSAVDRSKSSACVCGMLLGGEHPSRNGRSEHRGASRERESVRGRPVPMNGSWRGETVGG